MPTTPPAASQVPERLIYSIGVDEDQNRDGVYDIKFYCVPPARGSSSDPQEKEERFEEGRYNLAALTRKIRVLAIGNNNFNSDSTISRMTWRGDRDQAVRLMQKLGDLMCWTGESGKQIAGELNKKLGMEHFVQVHQDAAKAAAAERSGR